MPDWIRDKLAVPLIVGVAGFGLGRVSDEITARFFPPTQNAKVTSVTYQRGVRLGDYLKVTGNDSRRFTRSELRTRGAVVFAETDTTGYKGDELHLAATVLNAQTQRAAGVPEPSEWGRFFKPPSDTSQASPDVWVADPCRAGTYYVVVRVQRRIEQGDENLRHKAGPRFKLSRAHCSGSFSN